MNVLIGYDFGIESNKGGKLTNIVDVLEEIGYIHNVTFLKNLNSPVCQP